MVPQSRRQRSFGFYVPLLGDPPPVWTRELKKKPLQPDPTWYGTKVSAVQKPIKEAAPPPPPPPPQPTGGKGKKGGGMQGAFSWRKFRRYFHCPTRPGSMPPSLVTFAMIQRRKREEELANG